MDVETAIRTRRTHKAFAPEPLPREEIDELLELARWAPNHHLTAPWRFRVVGPAALERAEGGRRPGGRREARPRADPDRRLLPSLSGDPVQDEEDLHATAVASYIVLLAAHARGLAGYWRTPGAAAQRARAGDAVGLPDERALRRPPPPRAPAPGEGAARAPARRADHGTFLD